MEITYLFFQLCFALHIGVSVTGRYCDRTIVGMVLHALFYFASSYYQSTPTSYSVNDYYPLTITLLLNRDYTIEKLPAPVIIAFNLIQLLALILL
jgi:hypothetical protein